MTQEIKQKLKQAAKTYFNGDGSDELSPFKAGAQTILENPGEWGLTNDPYKDLILVEIIDGLKAENERYRKALERIATFDYPTTVIAPHHIAKEALKKEVNND